MRAVPILLALAVLVLIVLFAWAIQEFDRIMDMLRFVPS